jgi:hypothetical protein
MSVRVETLQKLVGRPVRDIYARFSGTVVGLSFDTNGQPRSIGIDHGSGFFIEYPSNRIIFEGENIILVPSWRVDVDRLRREITAMRKRIQALEDLAREGEVVPTAYDELRNQYNGRVSELQQTYNSLTGTLQQRVEELEGRREMLARFLGNVKVQFRTGEIDESTYRVAGQYIETMLERDNKEKEDIGAILASLGTPTPQLEAAPIVK